MPMTTGKWFPKTDRFYQMAATAFTVMCLAASLMFVSILVSVWEHTPANATVCGSQAK